MLMKTTIFILSLEPRETTGRYLREVDCLRAAECAQHHQGGRLQDYQEQHQHQYHHQHQINQHQKQHCAGGRLEDDDLPRGQPQVSNAVLGRPNLQSTSRTYWKDMRLGTNDEGPPLPLDPSPLPGLPGFVNTSYALLKSPEQHKKLWKPDIFVDKVIEIRFF